MSSNENSNDFDINAEDEQLLLDMMRANEANSSEARSSENNSAQDKNAETSQKSDTSKTEENQDCPICLNPIPTNDSYAVPQGCNHRYCTPCLSTWLKRDIKTTAVCPYCRKECRQMTIVINKTITWEELLERREKRRKERANSKKQS